MRKKFALGTKPKGLGRLEGREGRNEGLTLDKAKKANEEIKLDRFKKKRKEQSDKPKIPLGGGVRGSDKGSDIYSRIKQADRLKKIRKNFKGKKK